MVENAAIITNLFIATLVIAIIAMYKSSANISVAIVFINTFEIPCFLYLIIKYANTITVAIIVYSKYCLAISIKRTLGIVDFFMMLVADIELASFDKLYFSFILLLSLSRSSSVNRFASISA